MTLQHVALRTAVEDVVAADERVREALGTLEHESTLVRALEVMDALKSQAKELNQLKEKIAEQAVTVEKYKKLCDQVSAAGCTLDGAVWAYEKIVEMGAERGSVHSFVLRLQQEIDTLKGELAAVKSVNTEGVVAERDRLRRESEQLTGMVHRLQERIRKIREEASK